MSASLILIVQETLNKPPQRAELTPNVFGLLKINLSSFNLVLYGTRTGDFSPILFILDAPVPSTTFPIFQG